MCVVSHGNCGLGGDGDGMWWLVVRDKANGFGHMSGDVGALPECKVIH